MGTIVIDKDDAAISEETVCNEQNSVESDWCTNISRHCLPGKSNVYNNTLQYEIVGTPTQPQVK